MACGACVHIVVAGFGNVLRSDDGFGVAVVEELLGHGVPDGVEVVEVGIGGIHLVQMLFDPVDALVIIDAVEVDRPPGTVVVLEPEIEDVSILSVNARRDQLADMHLANPDRALMMAKAMDLLPPAVVMVGAVPFDADAPEHGLTDEMLRTVVPAAAEVRRVVQDLGIAWS